MVFLTIPAMALLKLFVNIGVLWELIISVVCFGILYILSLVISKNDVYVLLMSKMKSVFNKKKQIGKDSSVQDGCDTKSTQNGSACHEITNGDIISGENKVIQENNAEDSDMKEISELSKGDNSNDSE